MVYNLLLSIVSILSAASNHLNDFIGLGSLAEGDLAMQTIFIL